VRHGGKDTHAIPCKLIVRQFARLQHSVMLDRGLILTQSAIRRQLEAMPNDLFLVRLIHQKTRRAFPGERLWTATQLTSLATVRFLRIRNREGCDVYFQPYAAGRNAGYILLDLDGVGRTVLETMGADGLQPCLVLQTSAGHFQAWLHISNCALEPALATSVAQHLARTYGGDLASADWRHLGRLAGFTNQKPQRRISGGYAPWVKIVHAHAGLASSADGLLQSVSGWLMAQQESHPSMSCAPHEAGQTAAGPISPAQATQIYQHWMSRWRIAERFPQPDWSIVDLWVARQLLSQAIPVTEVRDIVQWGSPHFPRRHGNPEDYLQRTLARAAFPRPAGGPVFHLAEGGNAAQGVFPPTASRMSEGGCAEQPVNNGPRRRHPNPRVS